MARKKSTVEAYGYGKPREVDPDKALLEEVWRCAGHVEFFGNRIAQWQLDPATDDLDPEKAVWLRQYSEERERLIKAAKLAIDAGLAERQVALAEKQGELLAGALEAIFTGLRLTAEQRNRIPEVVPGVLAQLTSSEEAAYAHVTDFGRSENLLAEIERGQ